MSCYVTGEGGGQAERAATRRGSETDSNPDLDHELSSLDVPGEWGTGVNVHFFSSRLCNKRTSSVL